MPKEFRVSDDKKNRVTAPRKKKNHEHRKEDHPGNAALADLQQKVGNQAVKNLIAQRSGEGEYELDGETEQRIDQARGGGQSLDAAVQKKMGQALGQDLSGVRAHTSPESDELNQQLGARAFTTGQDIFFRSGEYNPHTEAGEELIAHELTHVVQQQSGKLDGGERMRVNAPGDRFEQEADDVAKAITRDEPDQVLQRQEIPEEEEVQLKNLQRQEEEEEVMMQPMEEEEEELQPKRVQRQEEEEDVMAMPVQRQEEEEEIMMQPLEEEEEEIQMERLQRQEEEELVLPKKG